MTADPLVLAVQAEPRIEHATIDVKRPAPSVEQQHIADEVFSREQSQAVVAILGMQTGLMLVQHLIAETFPPTTEEELRRREKDKPLEE